MPISIAENKHSKCTDATTEGSATELVSGNLHQDLNDEDPVILKPIMSAVQDTMQDLCIHVDSMHMTFDLLH